MTSRKTGNQKRKYAHNRYEDIDKCIWKVFDTFGHDEKIEILVYWTKKLQKERATFRKKAVKYDELTQNPTFSECIKEWNKKGFNVDIYAVEIIISNYSTVDKEEDEIEISIRLDKKTIFYVNDVELSFDLHHLLSKTLKALENNNETK